jgi:hypothetical protein
VVLDSAIAVGGMLSLKIGRPSVIPYQPEGLWEEKGEFSNVLLNYKQDTGKDLYRRSMYTFIRRTSPAPAMTTFDVPGREDCLVKRQETNTPLQPLVLMNDPQVMEASRVLAEKMQKNVGGDIHDKLVYGFRRAIGRIPNSEEIAVLTEMYEDERNRFSQNKKDMESLLGIGEYPIDSTLPPESTAALTLVASLMFNHYDFYTKQ